MKYSVSAFVALALASSSYAIKSCPPSLTVQDNFRHAINNTEAISDNIHCKYKDGSDGKGPSCYYDLTKYTLNPESSQGDASSEYCPSEMPDAADNDQAYTIRVPSGEPYPSPCIGVDGLYDGATVTIQECDGTNPNQFENQKWQFVGNTIRQADSDFCLDVTDGNVQDGTKLQIWTCAPDSPNQHWVNRGDMYGYLQLPYNRISLFSWDQCVDLTDGSTETGNQVQIYFCDANNSNQQWFLDTIV